MRKKIFSVKCPEHILFGDPLYFEEYSGKRLESLVVDYSLIDFLKHGWYWMKSRWKNSQST